MILLSYSPYPLLIPRLKGRYVNNDAIPKRFDRIPLYASLWSGPKASTVSPTLLTSLLKILMHCEQD